MQLKQGKKKIQPEFKKQITNSSTGTSFLSAQTRHHNHAIHQTAITHPREPKICPAIIQRLEPCLKSIFIENTIVVSYGTDNYTFDKLSSGEEKSYSSETSRTYINNSYHVIDLYWSIRSSTVNQYTLQANSSTTSPREVSL